jgi:hypothetical protein
MTKLHFSKRHAISLLGGGVTWGIILLGDFKLPPESIMTNIANWASIPALVISAIFYPEGGHTGGSPIGLIVAYVGSGLFFYALLWFLVLSWTSCRKKTSTS